MAYCSVTRSLFLGQWLNSWKLSPNGFDFHRKITTKTLRAYSSVNQKEIAKFEKMSENQNMWWNAHGKGDVGPLLRMNPTRAKFIRDWLVEAHLNRKPEITWDELKPLQGMKILDIGCGGGILSESLARMGAQVTGVDATKQAIEIARMHAQLDPENEARLIYKHTTAEELANTREIFDAVCAMEIVEHIDDQLSFVNTLKKLVKPGGALFMSTINKTIKAWALGILVAEHVLRLVKPGTHDWQKFVSPQTLSSYIVAPLSDPASRSKISEQEVHGSSHQDETLLQQHFDVIDIQGIIYNPLTGDWWLNRNDTSVNFILYAQSRLIDR